MNQYLVIFVILFSSFSSFAQTVPTTLIGKDISVTEFNKLTVNKPGLILDVRTPKEVSAGAIPNSININLFDDNFEARIDKLDKTKPVYVYCATGGRGGEAMETMNKKGFKEVYNLDGGFRAWKSAGK